MDSDVRTDVQRHRTGGIAGIRRESLGSFGCPKPWPIAFRDTLDHLIPMTGIRGRSGQLHRPERFTLLEVGCSGRLAWPVLWDTEVHVEHGLKRMLHLIGLEGQRQTFIRFHPSGLNVASVVVHLLSHQRLKFSQVITSVGLLGRSTSRHPRLRGSNSRSTWHFKV